MKSTASSKELNARFKSEPEGAGEWAGGGGGSVNYPIVTNDKQRLPRAPKDDRWRGEIYTE